jgi:hypothetical protein
MANIAKSDGASEAGASEAVKRLLAKFGISGFSALSQEQGIREILNKIGSKKDMGWEEVADLLSSQDPALRKIISATKRYESDLRYLQKLGPSITTPSTPGAGGLSNDKLWSVMGWKEHRPGEFVWSRPPNVSFRGRFPQTQATAYVANYERDFSAQAAANLIDPDSPMLPVTMEQAKEFRRQDEMWDRIDKARGKANARQTKMMFDADEKERQRRESVRVEMMDEHDRFIYENTDRFGKAGAEQVFRQRLLKELPPFFKDSKLSTKALIAMDKSLSGIKKTPLVGPMLGRMVQNPVAGVSAAIYGAIVAAFAASDRANATVTGWQNAANLYGMPSKEFQNAAYLAGLKDPGEISRLYGKLTTQFGDPEAIISALGSSMGGMSARERTFVAKDLGIDETTMALIDIMSKSGHLTPDQSRRISANKRKVDVVRTLGFTSESGIGGFMQSAFLSIPGMSGAAARDMESFNEGYNDALNLLQFDNIQKNIKATGEAAESLNESESSGGSTTNNSVSNSSHAVYINRVDVNTDNPEDFIRNMEGLAERTSGSHANILNSMDSRVMV